jgi:hypothetical protein
MFCYSIKDKLKTTWYVFPYDLNTRLTFIVSLFMIFRLCFFSCYNMVAKFYCQDYISYAHVLSSLVPTLNALHRLSRLWWCMSPQKLFFCYHLPTQGWAGVKLGDAWYVSNVSIIFDAPCLFTHHLLCVLLHFVAFLCIFWNYAINEMPQCQFPVFCCFCVSEKLHRKYSQNWTNKSQTFYFSWSITKFEDEIEGGQEPGSP